jgi:outer membrane lipoprotein-sorting protein
MKNVITKETISKAKSFRKSLLTSLCQREAIFPSLAKRGEGRFYSRCVFSYALLRRYAKTTFKFSCALAVYLAAILFLSYSRAMAVDNIATLIEMQKSIKTLRADFIQEKHSRLLEKPIVNKGIFSFRVPEMFVWDYQEDMKVVSNGREILIYYKKLREADIAGISRFPSFPASFSIESLLERYRVDIVEAKASGYVLKIVPVSAATPVREIIITLNEKAVPVEIKIFERTGDKTEIRFRNLKVNGMISDDVFSMKVPEGVTIRRH